jgi:hypothetical protein
MATKNAFGYNEWNTPAMPTNPYAGLGSSAATGMLEFLKNSKIKDALEGYKVFSEYGDALKDIKSRKELEEEARKRAAEDKAEFEKYRALNAGVFADEGGKPVEFDEDKAYKTALEQIYGAQFKGDENLRKTYERHPDAYKTFGGGDEFSSLEKLAGALEPWDAEKANRYLQMAQTGRSRRDNDIRAILSDYRNEWEKNAEQIYQNQRLRTDLEYKRDSAKDEKERDYYDAQLSQLKASDNAARERANLAAQYASETAGKLYGKDEAERLLNSMSRFDISAEPEVVKTEVAKVETPKATTYYQLNEALRSAVADGSFDYGYGDTELNRAIDKFASDLGYNINTTQWEDERKALIGNLSLKPKQKPAAPTETAKAWNGLPDKLSKTYADDEAELLGSIYDTYLESGGKGDTLLRSKKNEGLFSKLGNRLLQLNLNQGDTFASFFERDPEMRDAFLVAKNAKKTYADFVAMLKKSKGKAAPAEPAPAAPAPAPIPAPTTAPAAPARRSGPATSGGDGSTSGRLGINVRF